MSSEGDKQKVCQERQRHSQVQVRLTAKGGKKEKNEKLLTTKDAKDTKDTKKAKPLNGKDPKRGQPDVRPAVLEKRDEHE